MSISDIRLIVSDLDGTLLGKGSILLQENTRALQTAVSAGIKIAIASGRMALVCSRIALAMGLEDCYILGMNGGHILEKPFGRTIECHSYSTEQRNRCVQILKEEQCLFNLYTDRGVYTNQEFDEEGKNRFRSYFANCGCRVVIASNADEFAMSEQCLKFLVKQSNNLEGYNRACSAIASIPGLYMTSSAADNMEIMLSSASKAKAVKKITEILHIPIENVVAFGDFDNDVEMLTACGFSVAMGNAVDAAKTAARYVTRSHEDAGVAYAIRALLNGRQDLLKKTD